MGLPKPYYDMNRIAVLETENAKLKLQLSGKTNYCVSCAGWAKQLAEKDAMIAQLLNVLPDSTHEEDETWNWCWDALSSEAQDLVKSARHAAQREEE